MKISKTKKVQVDAKVLEVYLKVSDCFAAVLRDADGEMLKDYEGYVPGFMPGEHYGEYVILNIDIDTGVILNWKKPSAEDIEKFVEGEDE